MRSRLRPAILSTLVLLGLLAVGTARGADIAIDFDPEVDFSPFMTIGWLAGTPAEDPLVEKRIRVAVERELVGRGFKEVRENPDLLIVTHASIDIEPLVKVEEFEYWKGYSGWKKPVAAETDLWEPDIGTVIVDILDASTETLIWRGVARGNVAKKPEKRDLKINRAMAALFKKFPPN